LLAVAEQVSRRLGWKATEPCGGDWSTWLRRTVGSLRANHPELIEAIRDLGAPIATLDYDNLLSEVTHLRPITWQRAERWPLVLQGEDQAILHLHGHWDQPSSVVLGIRSYDAVMGGALAQHLQRALSLQSLVFVGCSGTLEDPNFSVLLTWMREQLNGAEHSHYLLIHEGEPLPSTKSLLREARVVPLHYGKENDDLLSFIRALASGTPISLFYSYSHRDEVLRSELEAHLSFLRRSKLIAEWPDRMIGAGDEWKGEIDRQLAEADIILLLVSADFIASDYCWGEEMAKTLARHQLGEARVIPVILRPCRWRSTPLGRLQAVPRDGKPVSEWPNIDAAWDDIASSIERVCHEIRYREIPGTEPITRAQIKRYKPLIILPLYGVFKQSGLPTVTFIEPPRFLHLKQALEQPGRGVIIEGPSGIGKTTALKHALNEITKKDRRPAEHWVTIDVVTRTDTLGLN
jgi:hypothetical protein